MDKDVLIRKYLEGKIQAAEANKLKKWLDSDQKNREEFEAFEAYWQMPADTDTRLERSLDEAHTRLQSKYSHFRLKRVLLPLAKYAAVGAIAVLFTYLIQNYKSVVQPVTDQYCEVRADLGHKSTVVLPDGSVVVLNSGTTIRYPANFSSKRNVYLTGEALFKVEKSEVPFEVFTKDYTVNVLGTRFNVMAYPDIDGTVTTLLEGLVNIRRGEDNYILKPGEKLLFRNGNISIEKADLKMASAWSNEQFYFNQVPFDELVVRLEHWFNVDIELADSSLYELKYSGVFRNEETIWQILDYISITENIKYQKTDHRKIRLYKNN
jgi:ferric-dicitrate binding protein FerR (iron transport regulator)